MKSSALRGSDVRRSNEKLVLYSIFARKYISQSGVSKLTGLRPSTVLRIFSNLSRNDLIEVVPGQENRNVTVGRQPVDYRIHADSRFSVGIWLDQETITTVILDFRETERFYFVLKRPEKNIELAIVRELRKLFTVLKLQDRKIIGVGIGWGGLCSVENPPPIDCKLIQRELNLSVTTLSSVTLAGFSANRALNLPGIRSHLTVLIDSGVHAEFSTTNPIPKSGDTLNIELSHVSIDMSGEECFCGGKGCLANSVSLKAIHREILKEKPSFDLKDLEETLKAGDSRIHDIFEKKSGILALALLNLYRMFTPDRIFITTYSRSLSDFFARKISELFEKTETRKNQRSIPVISGTLNTADAAKISAMIIIHRFFIP